MPRSPTGSCLVSLPAMFLCFSFFCFELLSLLDHIIHSFLNLYILLHCDLTPFFWPVLFVHNSHLEDAVDVGVHGYLTLRTTVACRGVLSSFPSLASLSHVSMPGCWRHLSSEGLYLMSEMVKSHMIRTAETPMTCLNNQRYKCNIQAETLEHIQISSAL